MNLTFQKTKNLRNDFPFSLLTVKILCLSSIIWILTRLIGKNYVRLKELPIHILFTSRETDLDSEKFLLPIHPLSKQEQLQLFMHYGRFTIPEDEYGDYFKIFNMVEGHTLLLELIAKTMTAETLTPEEMTDILYSPEYDDISKVVIEKGQ